MKKYIHIFLCLLIITTGCAKKKSTNQSNEKSINKKHQTKNQKKSTFDENLEAFALDDDSLHNFAHDKNKNSEHKKELNQSSTKSNSIFQWENIEADQSKNDFKIIYFEFDKYNITKDEEENLKADIKYAKKMIDLGKVIIIEGHACDSAGSAIYNMTLSEKRANFIATKFIDANINRSDIKIVARGQEMPLVKGGNKKQQSANRRVVIYALDNK